MHKQTVCKVLKKFQHGKYLEAYVLKCVNSNRYFIEEEKQRDTIQYGGQKQSIKFATYKTPEITRNQDSKVNCVLSGPYMT